MDLKISDLKIGAQLILGKYSVLTNGLPLPVVWLKCTPNNDFITQYVVDYLCFDANEPRNNEFRGSGNPNYGLSNILTFINSSDELWYHPMHPEDSPPNRIYSSASNHYESHSGFLYHFEEYEIESLVNVTIEVDGNRITSVVRLPSIEELIGEQRFQLFRKKGIRTQGSEDMVLYRSGHNFELNSFVPFWLCDRSPIFNRAMCLDRTATLISSLPRRSSGLRPVCTVNPDTSVILGEDGYYYIKPRTIQRNVYTDEELFELLGLAQP